MPTEDANTQEGNGEYHCPWDGCDRSLGSEHGLKCHHKRVHGESIAGASVECDWCGATKTVTPYKVDKYEHHFCSPEEDEDLSDCQRNWYSENLVGENSSAWSGNRVEVECSWCGDSKAVIPSRATNGDKFFCDTTCKGKWQSENCRGENSFKRRGGFRPVEVECPWCGETRKVKQSRAENTDNIFCEPPENSTISECQRSWMSENNSGENHPVWIPDKTLLKELRRLKDLLGRTPRRDDAKTHSHFGSSTFANRFGGWNAALKEAGFSPTHRVDIPTEDLIDELHRLSDELDRAPHSVDMADSGRFSPPAYRTHFGSWNRALEAAGLEPARQVNILSDDLLDELQRLANEFGRSPTYVEMTSDGKFGASIYEERFGSWVGAIKEAGLEPPKPQDYVPSGEDHYLWNGGLFPYGLGWNESKKEQVRERDNRTCQNPKCGRSEEEHVELFGQKHSVHHIQKARTFDDPDKRNHLDNLVTLCETEECHKRWEQMSPLRPQVHSSD